MAEDLVRFLTETAHDAAARSHCARRRFVLELADEVEELMALRAKLLARREAAVNANQLQLPLEIKARLPKLLTVGAVSASVRGTRPKRGLRIPRFISPRNRVAHALFRLWIESGPPRDGAAVSARHALDCARLTDIVWYSAVSPISSSIRQQPSGAGLYDLTPGCLRTLDKYEDAPRLYHRTNITVIHDNVPCDAMTYVMNAGPISPPPQVACVLWGNRLGHTD